MRMDGKFTFDDLFYLSDEALTCVLRVLVNNQATGIMFAGLSKADAAPLGRVFELLPALSRHLAYDELLTYLTEAIIENMDKRFLASYSMPGQSEKARQDRRDELMRIIRELDEKGIFKNQGGLETLSVRHCQPEAMEYAAGYWVQLHSSVVKEAKRFAAAIAAALHKDIWGPADLPYVMHFFVILSKRFGLLALDDMLPFVKDEYVRYGINTVLKLLLSEHRELEILLQNRMAVDGRDRWYLSYLKNIILAATCQYQPYFVDEIILSLTPKQHEVETYTMYGWVGGLLNDMKGK